MSEFQDQNCSLCKRHCPVDQLQCDRGRSYYANLYKETVEIDKKRENKEDIIMSKEYEEDNRTEENNSREHHHTDNDLKHPGEELMDLLRRSSHFLHHRRGGKRGQGRILKLLAEHPEISQKELQEILRIEPGSMSEVVIKLEHKGFITRAKDETDKRMTKLMITELGLELSKELEETDAHEEQFLLSSLDSEEQQQLKILLKKLLSGWETSYEAFREDRNHKECGHHGHCGHHHGHHGDHGHHGHSKDHDHQGDHNHHEGDHREHHKHHEHKDKDTHREHHHRHI